MPKKTNRRRMPRAEKGKAHPQPQKSNSHPVTRYTRARVKGRSSPKHTVQDWGPAYLRALAELGCITAAADVAGVDRHTVWDRRKADPAFAEAEREAREKGADALEDIAWQRATVGVGRLKFHNGEALRDPRDETGRTFYIEREVSDSLLITLLKAHRPEKFRENVEVSGKIEHLGLHEFRERVAKAKASVENRK